MSAVQCKACRRVFDQSDMSRHDCPQSPEARIAKLEGDVTALTSLVYTLWGRINLLEGRDELDGMP